MSVNADISSTSFNVFLCCSNIVQAPLASLPDDVQMMIYVCTITAISQTTCILRSIHARVVQLVRDGAWRGRTCGRHGQTLSILPPLWLSSSLALSLSLSPSPGAHGRFETSQEIRPHSIVLFGFQGWCSGNIPSFPPSALVISAVSCPGQGISSERSLDKRLITRLLLPPFLWIDWMLVTHRWSAADQATLLTTQRAQDERRETRHSRDAAPWSLESSTSCASEGNVGSQLYHKN